MKFYLICACLSIWALELALRPNIHVMVEAQSWNLSRVYTKPVEFEWTHRGSFNMSYCSRELVNCYEIFEIQIVCSFGHKFDSICSAMFQHCNDDYGDHVDYRGAYDLFGWGTFQLMNGFCEGNDDYTRRRAQGEQEHNLHENY